MTKEEFYEAHCANCGSQRCSGPNGGMAKGCPHYILEFEINDKKTEKEYVPFTFAIDGHEFEVLAEKNHMEQFKKFLGEKKQKTGYERVSKLLDYYYVSPGGQVNSSFDSCDIVDNELYGVANYYSDMSVALNNARADALMRALRRFAVEHRDSGIDWSRYDYKYAIRFSHGDKTLNVDYEVLGHDFGMIAFDNKETAELAIKTFHDELIWYFIEYKDSL